MGSAVGGALGNTPSPIVHIQMRWSQPHKQPSFTLRAVLGSFGDYREWSILPDIDTLQLHIPECVSVAVLPSDLPPVRSNKGSSL